MLLYVAVGSKNSPFCFPATRTTDLGNNSATNIAKKKKIGNKKERLNLINIMKNK
jgi:hypothetical protein